MALLRSCKNDTYSPEYGTLVVRDAARLDFDRVKGMDLLLPCAVDAQPGGTIARAGCGWLEASSRNDVEHHVHLEVHDAPPPEQAWDAAVETPYFSTTGRVVLSYMTSDGTSGESLRLGSPGLYRVRVSVCVNEDQENDEEGDTWYLQFWAIADDPEPPRCLARHEPAVSPEPSDWENLLEYDIKVMLWAAGAAAAANPTGVSAEQIAEWCARFQPCKSVKTLLDEPLWESLPAPRTTGHADRDAAAEKAHRSALADQRTRQEELAEIARQLGVAPPSTRREALPLFVAAGILGAEGDPVQYRAAPQLPRARDVLKLPPERLAAIAKYESFLRYAALASDIVALTWWTRPKPKKRSLRNMATRLLVTTDEVRGALRYATAQRLLRVDGDVDGTHVELRVLPRAEPERTVVVEFDSSPIMPNADVPPVTGAPPRAGFLTEEGKLVIAGEVVARLPHAHITRAMQTAFGTAILCYAREAFHVRHDGRIDVLAKSIDALTALGEDGRYLAVSVSHYGRKASRRLHLFDLADGSHQTLECDIKYTVRIIGVHRGAVYATLEDPNRDPGLRWVPGKDPEPLPWSPRHVDPLTGTVLADGPDRTLLVIDPDGTQHPMQVTSSAELAPGGTRLYDLRMDPPAITLFDVRTGSSDPLIHWLPSGVQVSKFVPGHPVWEDRDHLLLTRRWATSAKDRAVRVNVRTGQRERVPLDGASSETSLFVEPLLST